MLISNKAPQSKTGIDPLVDWSHRHAHAQSGAPLVHDHAAWDPRWKQGLASLQEHVILGYKAMPAGGQCLTCTPADHQALIRFMADQPEKP